MYEKQFLKDVAIQNYTKYGVNVSEWLGDQLPPHNISGRMYLVTPKLREEDGLRRTATTIFGHLFRQKSQLESKIQAHLPVYVESRAGERGKYLKIFL